VLPLLRQRLNEAAVTLQVLIWLLEQFEFESLDLKQWFPKWVVPPPGGAVEKLQGGGEPEIGDWGATGEPVNSYISVVLLTLSDEMSYKTA